MRLLADIVARPVIAIVILLSAFGAIGIAMSLGMLWNVPGSHPSRLRTVCLLVGINAVIMAVAAMIAVIDVRRNTREREERASRAWALLRTMAAFLVCCFAEGLFRWSGSYPMWFHQIMEASAIISFAAFVRTVYSTMRVNAEIEA